jgi:hypothetical protein
MASSFDAIAPGYSPVYHDESLSKFGATFAATGKDAAYVEYAIAGGSCEHRQQISPISEAVQCQTSHNPQSTISFRVMGADGAGGGAVDMFHTFTDPEHRGKVSSRSSAGLAARSPSDLLNVRQ